MPAFDVGFDSRSSSTFYMNRYWSMWKLPMYGATDAEMGESSYPSPQPRRLTRRSLPVMAECKKCAKAFPTAFVRLSGFDAVRQARLLRRHPPFFAHSARRTPHRCSACLSSPTARPAPCASRWTSARCPASPSKRSRDCCKEEMRGAGRLAALGLRGAIAVQGIRRTPGMVMLSQTT